MDDATTWMLKTHPLGAARFEADNLRPSLPEEVSS
jgi:hypothetical protein